MPIICGHKSLTQGVVRQLTDVTLGWYILPFQGEEIDVLFIEINNDFGRMTLFQGVVHQLTDVVFGWDTLPFQGEKINILFTDVNIDFECT